MRFRICASAQRIHCWSNTSIRLIRCCCEGLSDVRTSSVIELLRHSRLRLVVRIEKGSIAGEIVAAKIGIHLHDLSL